MFLLESFHSIDNGTRKKDEEKKCVSINRKGVNASADAHRCQLGIQMEYNYLIKCLLCWRLFFISFALGNGTLNLVHFNRVDGVPR